MLKALRLTNKTVAKISKETRKPKADLQAMMEHYSDGRLRPYVVVNHSSPLSPWLNESLIYSSQKFEQSFAFVDEEDPCMFTEVIKK